MFKSLEYVIGQKIELENILRHLVHFGYHKTKMVRVEGDFAQRGSVVDIFPSNFEGPVRLDVDDDIIRSIGSFNMESGKVIWQHQMVIILPAKEAAPSSPFSSETPLNNFVDIAKGDYVVHNHHGIGRFLGVKDFKVKEEDQSHLVIEYEGGDKLFVPRHDIHLVQKYVSFAQKAPRLYKLGNKEWEATRRKIEKSLQDIAAQLLHVQAARTSLTGFKCSPDTEWQKDFEKRFPFEETPDQLKATAEVKTDMESGQPMDRLLCGDVGYGKTEVALRAIFKAVMDNKQVAVLVPTTILAEQHYYNFSKRVKDFPVRVAMLSRFRTKAEQTKIVKEVAEGKVDVVVGTHRLLSKDIRFKDLALVVIDEEQRFGVKSKERLKNYRLLVHVLTLTATPIPRTLYMALAGARDMSVISTPPQNRIPVSTHVIHFDEKLIKDAIERELKRKGQVFFLHNRIEDIDQIGNIIKRLVKDARIAVAHGQMPGKLLEEIMLQFLKGEVDILVCTSIIESGIDIPNANTLIINRADRFGLSELHQLRGRVGRMDVKAYAYFVVPPEYRVSDIARKRLEAIEKHSDLGAGFQIAFEDLQIRGAGNLLGQQQHGFISTIGFDLYCRLLKQSIDHLKKKIKGRKHEESRDAK